MFENKPVIFKCRLSSKKVAANITWYKDGQSVSEAYPSYKVTPFRWGSRLRIRRAKAKDAGIFQCRAKGPGGMATAHAWLKINGFLNTPPITSTVSLIICVYWLFFNSLRPLVRISLCSLLVFVVFNSIGVAIALVVVFRAHLGDDLSDVIKQFFVKLQALQQSWTVVIVVRNDVGTKAWRHVAGITGWG